MMRSGQDIGEIRELTPKLVVRIVLRLAVIVGLLAAILFLSAGRLDWLEAWVFVAVYGSFLVMYAVWSVFRDPAQLQERGRVAENVKSWDKTILGIYTVLLVPLFVLAGLDAGRFGWSSPPLAMAIIGWVGLIAASLLVFWALMVNTYLSRMVRIQSDRGHQVVTTGPYRYVRHPMYVGIIVLFLCVPLVLGSWWAEIPAALIAMLYVIRTVLEDRTLKEELEGYKEYAQQVCYRLLPGVW